MGLFHDVYWFYLLFISLVYSQIIESKDHYILSIHTKHISTQLYKCTVGIAVVNEAQTTETSICISIKK